MKITGTAVRNPITTLMIFAAMFVLGFISLSRLGLDLFPDITMPTVAVYTVYPGVGPYEVESGVTKPLEDTVSSLNRVEEISSTSSEGVSTIVVSFASGTDVDDMLPDIRAKLRNVEDNLPEGAESPQIFKYNPELLPTLRFTISTNTEGIDVRELAQDEIVPELQKLVGVGNVSIFGGKEKAVMCRLDIEEIGKRGIPISQIQQSFRADNISLPGGSVTLDGRYIMLRTVGEFKEISDIENVLVGYKGQVPIYLKDVAEISVSNLPQEEFLRADAKEGIILSIQKQPGYNTVQVNDRVKAKIEDLKPALPPSANINIQSDQSKSILESIGGVTQAAWQGGLLAIVVLLLFLRNIRSTLIISFVIPVSVISTFALMAAMGLTINIVSLMGITLGIGMFVDNSIVVLESIYRKQLSGESKHDSAINGTSEVGTAITASTITTMSVFLPLLFVEGIAGIIFNDLSYTIAFSLFISLAASLSLTPVACSKFLKLDESAVLHKPKEEMTEEELNDLSLADVHISTGNKFIDGISNTIQNWLIKLDNAYEKGIRLALKHSVTVIVSAVLLFGLSIGSILLLGMEFIPQTDEGQFSVSMETRLGVPYEYTTEKVKQTEQIIQKVVGKKNIKSLASQIGRASGSIGVSETGSNLATINVTLVQKDLRDISIWQAVNRITERANNEVMDVKFNFTIEGMSSLASSASGGSSPIVLELTGENLDNIYSYAQKLEDIIENTDGARDVEISHKTGKPELQFRVKRQQAFSLGLNPYEIASTVRTAFKGTEVSRLTLNETDYNIVLILNEEDRNSMDTIRNMFFINKQGTKIPFENVVSIEEAKGPISIQRKNRTRLINVTAALTGERALNRVVADIRQSINESASPPPNITLEVTGAAEEMESSFRDLMYALMLAVALVYMVMASQFESLLHPFIVMFSIPFAVIGLVAALLITGTTFNIIAFVGGILLVGLVVNNAIVLIDYINLLRKRGMNLKDAIVKGGKTRLKPILMTSTTTILGMIPMALGFATGAEIRAPMGRAIVGGLTTSTLVTLVLIPTLYWIIESRLVKRRKSYENSETPQNA